MSLFPDDNTKLYSHSISWIELDIPDQWPQANISGWPAKLGIHSQMSPMTHSCNQSYHCYHFPHPQPSLCSNWTALHLSGLCCMLSGIRWLPGSGNQLRNGLLCVCSPFPYYTQISYTVCDFTHSVWFYTQCITVHTEQLQIDKTIAILRFCWTISG